MDTQAQPITSTIPTTIEFTAVYLLHPRFAWLARTPDAIVYEATHDDDGQPYLTTIQPDADRVGYGGLYLDANNTGEIMVIPTSVEAFHRDAYLANDVRN